MRKKLSPVAVSTPVRAPEPRSRSRQRECATRASYAMQPPSHSTSAPTRGGRSQKVARGDEEEERVRRAEGQEPEGLRVDKEVVSDLVAHLLSPSSPPSRRKILSSTRRLVSPNLVVSFPFLPVPEPGQPLSTASPVHELVTASQQALAVFRLPTLAVSLLPFASWDLSALGIEETSLALTVPEHVEASSEGKGKGKEREVEHIEHADRVQVVERWSANVEWTLRIDSPPVSRVQQSAGRTKRPAWLESTTAPRKVELVFASRPHVESTRRGRQQRGVASVAGRRHYVLSSSGDDGVEREIGATSSASLVEKAAEEEHSLELVYLRYTIPTFALPFLASHPLFDLVRLLVAVLLPVTAYLLALVGLDQQLQVDKPRQLVAPRLTHHTKRKLETTTSALRVGTPARKRRKYRDSAPPAASTSAGREPEPVVETAHAGEASELHVGHHSHLSRHRRWSVSTPFSLPASRSASGSSATLQPSPERIPGPSPWAPRPPVALFAVVELVGAACAGVVAAWRELAILLWIVRQAILFATELVEEGWVVAKEVLRQPPPDARRRRSQGGSEQGGSEGSGAGGAARRRSAMSGGHRHQRESIQHRHVTFSASGDSPSTHSLTPSPPNDDREPAVLDLAVDAPAEHDRPDAAAAYALSQLHALVSRQAASEGRSLAPTLAAEDSSLSGEQESEGAETRAGREDTAGEHQHLGAEEQSGQTCTAQASSGYEFPPRSAGPRTRSSADDDDDAEHSASTSGPGPGGRLSPFSALSQGDVASTAAASQPSSRRGSLVPFQPSPRRSRFERADPPFAAPARRGSLGVAGRSSQAQQAAGSLSRAQVGSGTEQEEESCGQGEQHCAWRGDTSSSTASSAAYYTPQSHASPISPITPVRPRSAGSSPHSSPEDPIPSEYRLPTSTSARPVAARSSSDSVVELSALGPQSVFAPAFHPAVMGVGAGRGVQPRPRTSQPPQPVPQQLPQPAPAPDPHPQPRPRPPLPPQRQLYVPPQAAGMTITLSSDEDDDDDEAGGETTTTTSGSPSGGRKKKKQRGKKKNKGRRGAGGGSGGASGAPQEEDPLKAAGGSPSRPLFA
ncbi:uncharacterized protein RHOBADRAFT_52155 [Rhodotorula graminis WP1]|uniref:Uncharacterized protein n=1 Tax=Rhodotorula graminis (strain WP1) TaxID=578459 RepID=A0A194S9E4_RHOGW|nr:uncharacterized protein RHOBADRAFT_52155 [Rhodotorula graminis WP1]KPV77217.1 hypothetical protein RHOBADRAFT_52155 [Rhodotorula graminis WP1]